MINERAFLGYSLDFHNICRVYPPKVKEIIAESKYPIYRELLTKTEEDLEEEWEEKGIDSPIPTPLDFLMMAYQDSEKNEEIIKKAFYFFIREPVTFIVKEEAIIIGNLQEELQKKAVEELRILNKVNFLEFQNLIRSSLGMEEFTPYVPDPEEHPKVVEMKRKARLRDRIKRKKSSKEGLDMGSTLTVICCMDFGLNPLNIGEISYAAIGPLIRYYQEKRKYNTDISTLLAGGDSKKIKPIDWIRNIKD